MMCDAFAILLLVHIIIIFRMLVVGYTTSMCGGMMNASDAPSNERKGEWWRWSVLLQQIYIYIHRLIGIACTSAERTPNSERKMKCEMPCAWGARINVVKPCRQIVSAKFAIFLFFFLPSSRFVSCSISHEYYAYVAGPENIVQNVRKWCDREYGIAREQCTERAHIEFDMKISQMTNTISVVAFVSRWSAPRRPHTIWPCIDWKGARMRNGPRAASFSTASRGLCIDFNAHDWITATDSRWQFEKIMPSMGVRCDNDAVSKGNLALYFIESNEHVHPLGITRVSLLLADSSASDICALEFSTETILSLCLHYVLLVTASRQFFLLSFFKLF